jgi:hypothetical protein
MHLRRPNARHNGEIQAVRDFKPYVVLNELTDLPDDAAQISKLANLNARIRTEESFVDRFLVTFKDYPQRQKAASFNESSGK